MSADQQIDIEKITRQCWRCKKYKPLKEFVKDKRRRYGRGSQCTMCSREYQRMRYYGQHKPAGRLGVKIGKRTPFTIWRKLEFILWLQDFMETGVWPSFPPVQQGKRGDGNAN